MVPWYFAYATWIAAISAVALVGGTAIFAVWWGGRRARDQAPKRCAALGAPRREVRASDDGQLVTLEGVLVAEPAPCARYEDGAPAAATTLEVSAERTWHAPPKIASTTHRRAADLTLRVGSREVELEGPVAVWVGTREYWPGRSMGRLPATTATDVMQESGFDPRSFDGFPVFRSIADGSEVIVRGRLACQRADVDRAAGYREAAVRHVLKPEGAEGIAIASLRAPRFVSRRHILLAGPSLVVGAALVAYAQLFVQVDRDDLADCAVPCHEEGRCEAVARWSAFGSQVSCLQTKPLPCRQMRSCIEEGRCSDGGSGVCVAMSRADCAATEACRREGRCTPSGGPCVVGEGDCPASAVCEEEGWCTTLRWRDGSACGRGSDADCSRGPKCRLVGLCSWVDGRCTAASDADCRQTKSCESDGLCSYDPTNQRCHAGGDEDCRGAEACARRGRCFAVDGVCRTERDVIARRQR